MNDSYRYKLLYNEQGENLWSKPVYQTEAIRTRPSEPGHQLWAIRPRPSNPGHHTQAIKPWPCNLFS